MKLYSGWLELEPIFDFSDDFISLRFLKQIIGENEMSQKHHAYNVEQKYITPCSYSMKTSKTSNVRHFNQTEEISSKHGHVGIQFSNLYEVAMDNFK